MAFLRLEPLRRPLGWRMFRMRILRGLKVDSYLAFIRRNWGELDPAHCDDRWDSRLAFLHGLFEPLCEREAAGRRRLPVCACGPILSFNGLGREHISIRKAKSFALDISELISAYERWS